MFHRLSRIALSVGTTLFGIELTTKYSICWELVIFTDFLQIQMLLKALSAPPFGNYRVWWSLSDSKYGGTALFVKKEFQPKKVSFSLDRTGNLAICVKHWRLLMILRCTLSIAVLLKFEVDFLWLLLNLWTSRKILIT